MQLKRASLFLAFFFIAGVISRALAADTWTGAGPNPIWSSALQWSNGAPPVVGDDVFMLGPGHPINTANVGGSFPTWTLNTLQFSGAAPTFVIHITSMTITGGSGSGIINNSGKLQVLDVDPGNSNTPALPGSLNFGQNAVVGTVQINNNGGTAVGGGGPKEGGVTTFKAFSSAGQATINNYAAAVSPVGSAFATAGQLVFQDSTNGGSATINNVGGMFDGTAGGTTLFKNSASAGLSTIFNIGGSANNTGGGSTSFQNDSSAGDGTILNLGSSSNGFDVHGAYTSFDGNSTGGLSKITNAAGVTVGGATVFSGGSTASFAKITNSGGTLSAGVGGETDFLGTANAGIATINNEAGLKSGGATKFSSGASAASATINNNGAGLFGFAGHTDFVGTATAGSAFITNNGGGTFLGAGGQTTFSDTAAAGNATLIANAGAPSAGKFQLRGEGGMILFNANSTGGTSRVEVFGNGSVDISNHASSGVTIGSLQGDGNAFLGANKLSVGSNNSNTTFSGNAQDGGSGGGIGGSINKVGSGTWTVSGTNSYTGSTTVSAGTLLVDGSIATSSLVTVNAGAILGGHGVVSSIAGAGEVAPGDSPGILTGTQLDPSANMSFAFQMTQAGSPTYNDAASSGNDLLHLTGLNPFTSSMTDGNLITIDFTGATLEAGQFYRGGFFTDALTDPSMLANATFVYLGLDGFDVQFDGFVTELNANFASGTIFDGSLMQFDITGKGGGSTVPEAGSSLLLLFLALIPLSLPGASDFLKSQLNRSPK